jgi:ABC-type oligopeptide transport system substrate-binding subunit
MRLSYSIFWAIVATTLALLPGCRVNRSTKDHATNQILYQATASDPRTFNPILITDATSGKLTAELFESIIRINPKNT